MKHYKKKNIETKAKPKVSILSEYKNKNKLKNSVRIANTPYLVILESPSKCKKIETYLGFQYKCIASNGHIRGLTRIKRSKDCFEPVFDILPEKAAHVADMREIINHFLPTPENIFIATDDDREGEAIGWHICQTFGLPLEKVRRMLFHEITEKVIQDAARNTTTIRMPIVMAQQTRQILDQMVGFEISPLLTKRLSTGEPLSAGRCQTPALRFVYDKQTPCIISTDKLEYQITGSFFSQIPSTASFQFPLEATLTESLASESEVLTFLELSKTFKHEMTLSNPTKHSTSPPIPFNTSRFLQYTSSRWNMSPKKTMEYCQTLYQHGYITYMRTESSKYSEVFLGQIRNYLSEQEMRSDYHLLLDNTRHNPHEAIRVTDIRMRELDLGDTYSEGDKKRIFDIYEAIWKRSIQSCMCHYEYKHVDVFFSAAQEKKYHTSLEIPMVEGFMRFSSDDFLDGSVELLDVSYKKKKTKISFIEIQTQRNGVYLFLQSAKSPITCVKIEATFDILDKPKSLYYTESALIQTLETHGIGRPSTYAMLVDTIQEREYVKKQDIEGRVLVGKVYVLDMIHKEISSFTKEKRFGQEKNKLVLQPLGKKVIETLLPAFDNLFSYGYTQGMEQKLDKIIESPVEHNTFEICREVEIMLKNQTKEWKMELQEKYEIGDRHELFFSKKGVFIREKKENGSQDKLDLSIESELDPSGGVLFRLENNITTIPTKNGLLRVRDIPLDMVKLKRKEYTLEELLEIPNEYLGDYQEKTVLIRNGKYGTYIEWGENTIRIPRKELKKELWEITLTDILPFLSMKISIENQNPTAIKNTNILRELSETLSIRKGKFGAYIYYSVVVGNSETKKKKSPFYPLKLFPEDWKTCDSKVLLEWIEKTYGII